MYKSSLLLLSVILVLSLVIRLFDLSNPFLTVDEARLAYRGYTLSNFSQDELDRSLPWIFNSSNDYQLPLSSYVSAAGIKIFGKSDLGVRIPFILLGVLSILLIYKIALLIRPVKKFGLFAAIVVGFSPALFFVSRIPNDVILLVFLLLLYIYLFGRKANFFVLLLITFLSMLVSKDAWFIVLPFILVTTRLFSKKLSFTLIVSSLLVILLVGLFLSIPQSVRSLLENQLTIVDNLTIENGINRLRGQSIESGWSSLLSRFLFSKLHLIWVGLLHWLSYFSLSTYFGEFDMNGKLGFASLGGFSKYLIIPFLAGIFYLIKTGNFKERWFIVYLLALTFPAFFSYPNFRLELVILTLPIMAIVIALGLISLPMIISTLLIALSILDLVVNLAFPNLEIRNTNLSRPSWIKPIVRDINPQGKTIISDNIIADLLIYYQWSNLDSPTGITNNLNLDYPYKFHQFQVGNISELTNGQELEECSLYDPKDVFLHSDNFENILEDKNVSIDKSYYDNLGNSVAVKFRRSLCLKSQ